MRWELDWLESRAGLTPEAAAIADAGTDQVWSYREVNDRAKAIAVWLGEKGVQKGDRVALLAPNGINYFDLLFACGKIGAIFVPLNWRLSPDELAYIINDCEPSLLAFHSNYIKEVTMMWDREDRCIQINGSHYEMLFAQNTIRLDAERVRVEEEDPLAMIYTGGTTGKPKGAVLSHRAIIWNGISTIASWNLTHEDRTVTYLPLFHTGGLNALSIPILMAGGTVVLANDFTPEKAIENLIRYKATIVLFVPTMHHMLVKSEHFRNAEFKDIKVFLSGGAPCPLEIYEAYKQKGISFKEGYGLTEAGPNNFCIDPSEADVKRGSVGKPMLFHSVRILDEDGNEAGADMVGELAIQGNHAFSYYWKNKEATEGTLKDGWLYTGDLAKRDKDGYYYIVGRKKEMIITGGENVYPLEVEHWLCSHPSIREAAVVGMPDDKWGEVVTAFIVLEEGVSFGEAEAKMHCRQKLGGYKVPKRIHVIDQMPKTHVGKIDKKELKETATGVSNQKPVS
ncbi:class I adenylate-forming enzyme family protein [Mesobacillus subterraneus]|uniref:Long-chain fatty acid--CoA ligase n=1 Tax=Mesobacillus subterraneus TaxID=285983 RepID=A0A3R9EDI3_9BACI|nr:long-chain fatty acid--CoA ligase [Mesobacillus subterraneus]RSD29325.1 long-chain fatty acid--CoA ligase [Mesobacillus subterraneus]